MSRHRVGFNRLQGIQKFNAEQATKHRKPVTPEDFGWKRDDFHLYWLEGVTDVHLEKCNGYGFILVYHEFNDRRMHVAPGLLGRLTEFIKQENGLCEAEKTPTSKA